MKDLSNNPPNRPVSLTRTLQVGTYGRSMPEARIFPQKMNDKGKGVHQNAFNAFLNAERKRRIKKQVS